MSINKKSKYVCPDCGHERYEKPAKEIICDQHSKQVKMIELAKGVIQK